MPAHRDHAISLSHKEHFECDDSGCLSAASIRQKSVRGGLITAASQGLVLAIQLTSTVILARILTPGDFGIVAMVAAFTGFAGLFRDLGLSAAAVQKADLSAAQQGNLFWLNVAAGACLTGVVAVASPLVAWFYQRPELQPVTLVLSAVFLLSSMGTQHGARLIRGMQFGRNAVAALGGPVAALGVGTTLAWLGWSYWALVWAVLANAATTTVLLWILSPLRPSLPQLGSGVRGMLRFGVNVTAYDVANYFHRNLDNILIGRVWGAEVLGFYSRAYQLMMVPVHSLRTPVFTVTYPALCRLQEMPGPFRAYVRQSTTVLAMLSMPFAALVFTIAPDLIPLLLGPGWEGVVPVFSILAFVAFIQPVSTIWGQVTLSLGKSARYLGLGVIKSAVVVGGFFVGIRWGAVGVATAYACCTYLLVLPTLTAAFRGSGVTVRDFLQAIARPALASAAAATATVLMRHFAGLLVPLVALVACTAVFAVVLFVTFALLPGGRRELLVTWSALRKALSGQH